MDLSFNDDSLKNIFEKIAQYDNVDHQMLTEIVSQNAKIVKITDEDKIAMFENTKTVNSIVKMHEEALDIKTEEVDNIKKEIHNFKITNQELLEKMQEVEGKKNNNDLLERCPEIKPFSCKYCEKSFLQVHKVKEHIKVHNSISEDLKNELKSLKTLVGELEVKFKKSQNGQENEFKIRRHNGNTSARS